MDLERAESEHACVWSAATQDSCAPHTATRRAAGLSIAESPKRGVRPGDDSDLAVGALRAGERTAAVSVGVRPGP